MNRIKAFIRKEFFHIFRDKRTLLILFGMPVVQIMLFGYAITNEIRDAKIAILDLSKDNISQKITNKILSSGYFILYDKLQNYDEIEKSFQTGKVKEVIVFDRDFAENLNKSGQANVDIVVDATDPNTGTTILNYTKSIIQNYEMELNQTVHAGFTIIPEVKMDYNPELKGVYLFVPGTITVILMLVSAMMTSISLTKEKEMGSMEVLLVSPMKPIVVIISKVIPYLLLSFTNAVIILLLGNFVFGVPNHGSTILLLSEVALFILTALSLGIFISTKAKTQQVALMISLMGLMLPTILLSGFIFPIANMPEWLQCITLLNPSRWFMVIVKDIMLKGCGIEFIWKETLILVCFTAFFIFLSIKNYKVRL